MTRRRAFAAAALLAAAAGLLYWGAFAALSRALTPPEREGAAFGAFFAESAAPREAPWPFEGDVEIDLGRVETAKFRAEGVRVRLSPKSASDAKRGEFAQIVIEFGELAFARGTLRDVVLDCRGVTLDLARLLDRKGLRFHRLEEVRPSVRVPAAFLAGFVPGVPLAPVPGGLEVGGRSMGLRWHGRFTAELSEGALRAGWSSLEWAGLPAPAPLLRRTWRSYPLSPTAERPFRIVLHEITFSPEGVVIQ